MVFPSGVPPQNPPPPPKKSKNNTNEKDKNTHEARCQRKRKADPTRPVSTPLGPVEPQSAASRRASSWPASDMARPSSRRRGFGNFEGRPGSFFSGGLVGYFLNVFPESIAKGSSGKIAGLITQLNWHEPTCTSLIALPNLHEPTYTSQLAQPTYTSQLARANLHKPTCTSQLAQANLHEPTCTSQLARANLHEPTCTSQLARANLHEPTCTRTTCTRYHTAKLARDIWTQK